MEIETLKKSHKKEIIIGISLFVILVIALVVKLTFAKYNLVKSMEIAEGTINYKLPDFKMMAMYKNDGNGDIEINTMPDKGYTINESKSYCTLDNKNKDTKAKLYTDKDGLHIISGLSKSSKCYLYFDKQKTAGETILGNVTVNNGTPDFSKTSCATGTNNGSNCGEANSGVYKANDNDGESYYFRGSVTNNYVKFANKFWRIIRINGDGSIRLIYDGTSAHQNGEVTTDSIASASKRFNANADDNAYVGFRYTTGQVRGLEAAYIRIANSTKLPVLTCTNASDLYTLSSSTKGNKSLTYPIGLISADEVSMAGGVTGQNNYGYYLYNGQSYWTLSPYYFSGSHASMFGVYTASLTGWSMDLAIGVRPVINLKVDITLTGKGTASDPYVVL